MLSNVENNIDLGKAGEVVIRNGSLARKGKVRKVLLFISLFVTQSHRLLSSTTMIRLSTVH